MKVLSRTIAVSWCLVSVFGVSAALGQTPGAAPEAAEAAPAPSAPAQGAPVPGTPESVQPEPSPTGESPSAPGGPQMTGAPPLEAQGVTPAPTQPPSAAPPPVAPPPAPYESVEEPPEVAENRWGQRYFGLAANIGPYSGFGLGVRAGHPRVGFEGSFAYNPILVGYTDPAGDAQFELFNSMQVNANIYGVFGVIKDRVGIGAKLGAKYNSFLGIGGGGAAYVAINLTRTLGLQAAIGLAIYPEGEERVKEALPDPCGDQSGCFGDYQFSVSPIAQIGLSIGIVWYPG